MLVACSLYIPRNGMDAIYEQRKGKRCMNAFDELGTEKLLSIYKRMTLIRRFEEHVYFLFLQGEIQELSTSIRDRKRLP